MRRADAGCKPEMTDAELEAAELADEQAEPVEWNAGPVGSMKSP